MSTNREQPEGWAGVRPEPAKGDGWRDVAQHPDALPVKTDMPANRKAREMTPDELAADRAPSGGTGDNPVIIPTEAEKPAPLRAISSGRPDSYEGAQVVFDEVRQMAIGFIKRTEAVEAQLNYIVATVYTNLRCRTGEAEVSCLLVEWMDEEIKKLNELKTKTFNEG